MDNTYKEINQEIICANILQGETKMILMWLALVKNGGPCYTPHWWDVFRLFQRLENYGEIFQPHVLFIYAFQMHASYDQGPIQIVLA